MKDVELVMIQLFRHVPEAPGSVAETLNTRLFDASSTFVSPEAVPVVVLMEGFC
jgi:hypothetical protein